jgi:PIN domain nuclease of toxin-antitoxin system
VRILIDTHLLLWALSSPRKLSTRARQLIEKSEVYVSAASIWEISIKAALGKLSASSSDVLAAVDPAGFALLPVSGEHAAHVADLPLHHKDPFDRLLVAQARSEPMRLLSNDELLRAYGDFVIIA